jgi:putative membrane protein
MVRLIKAVFFFLILVVGLVLHVKNEQMVTVNYYLSSLELPVSLLITVTLLFGALLGILVSLTMILSLKRKVASLNRIIRQAEKQGALSPTEHVPG